MPLYTSDFPKAQEVVRSYHSRDCKMLTAESTLSFRNWQPEYAAHNIPTFPVQIEPDRKKPMVSNYCRFGIPASTGISRKYPDATAIGFMAGKRSRLTILDVDTTDERVLADALNRHGQTPLIVRSGSGHHQAWYKNNGEARQIRPFGPDNPIDILGGGFVVAPPSRAIKGDYQFIQGGLDDLNSLPVLRNIHLDIATEHISVDLPPQGPVSQGNRNTALWEYCMKQAHHCADFDILLDKAKTRNEGNNKPPMTDTEVFKIAKSAWEYTVTGQNRFGKGIRLAAIEANSIMGSNPDAYLLLKYLRDQNGPQRIFMVANGLHETFRWSRQRFAKARSYLMEHGHLSRVRGASSQAGVALYRWQHRPRPVLPQETLSGLSLLDELIKRAER
jgi:hypothetical protein